MSLNRSIVLSSQEPILFTKMVQTWPIISWSLQDWCHKIGAKRKLPFRVGKNSSTVIPQWESKCNLVELTLEEFLESTSADSEQWHYFDYKHLHEWFEEQPEILESVDWANAGFPERKGSDSTLWIGSKGAHTPCHIDTYGFNLVAQIHGQKQWILFPPGNSKELRATRVPYEESSIYSDINFFSPSKDLMLAGARIVTLNPGDVLFVPNGWWHYVETLSTVAISINTWVPLPSDNHRRVDESIVKFWVASVCRFSEIGPQILNPNETDLTEDENLLHYIKIAMSYGAENETDDGGEPPSKKLCPTEYESLHQILEPVTKEEFVNLMNAKRNRFKAKLDTSDSENANDSNLEFEKKLVNVVCDPEVLQLIARKLRE